jgi:hypothetical protein
MFLPLGWALNPTLVPSFVPTTANMQERRPSYSGNTLPEYNTFDSNGPPAYPLNDLPEAPARPKEAHTRSPRDETRAGASSPGLVNDYVHMQEGLNLDVEANMAAATVWLVTSFPRSQPSHWCLDRPPGSADQPQSK